MPTKDNELVSRAPAKPRAKISDHVTITIPASGPGFAAASPTSVSCPKCRTQWFWPAGNQPPLITCHCGFYFDPAQAIKWQTATASPTYMKSQLQKPLYPGSTLYVACPHCGSEMAKNGNVLASDVFEYECSGLTGTRHTVVVRDDTLLPSKGVSLGYNVP